MARCVVDASVLLLTVQREDRDARALAARRLLPPLQETHGLVAPALLAWEVGQVVHRKRATEWKDEEHRHRTVRLLLEDVELVPPDAEGLARTGQLAERHSLSFYDAAYLALALQSEDRILLTEDATLHRAGSGLLGDRRCLDLDSLDRTRGRPAATP